VEAAVTITPIASLPDPDEDLPCHACGQRVPLVLALRGGGGIANCCYCGNQILLCQGCADRLIEELETLNAETLDAARKRLKAAWGRDLPPNSPL
jgi:hypothetical protein